MLCKKCENNIKSDFKYCPYCGERIVNDFHDQFHNLTPPFVIHDVQEIDDASQLYASAPGEQAPDLKLPSFAASFHEEPKESPYFVYRPDGDKPKPENKPPAGRATPHQSAQKQEVSVHEEKQEKKGISLGFKLFLIVLLLLLAFVITVGAYQLLSAPEPFLNFDLSAMFASVYFK
ncbi:hypothetical protein V6615_01985 [Oscillospiraceae bacterium PP1C4]